MSLAQSRKRSRIHRYADAVRRSRYIDFALVVKCDDFPVKEEAAADAQIWLLIRHGKERQIALVPTRHGDAVACRKKVRAQEVSIGAHVMMNGRIDDDHVILLLLRTRFIIVLYMDAERSHGEMLRAHIVLHDVLQVIEGSVPFFGVERSFIYARLVEDDGAKHLLLDLRYRELGRNRRREGGGWDIEQNHGEKFAAKIRQKIVPLKTSTRKALFGLCGAHGDEVVVSAEVIEEEDVLFNVSNERAKLW